MESNSHFQNENKEDLRSNEYLYDQIETNNIEEIQPIISNASIENNIEHNSNNNDLLFDPLFCGLYSGEFNIDTGTEINQAISIGDLPSDFKKNIFNLWDIENENSRMNEETIEKVFRIIKPSLSMILPDGAHQVVQDSFLNILPLGEWTTSTSTSIHIDSKLKSDNNDSQNSNQNNSFIDKDNLSLEENLKDYNTELSENTSIINSPISMNDTSLSVPHSNSVKLFSYLVYKQMQKLNMKRNARVKALMFVTNSKNCIYLKNILFACLNEIFAIDFLEEDKTQEERHSQVRNLMIDLLKSILSLRVPDVNDLLFNSTKELSKTETISNAISLCFSDVLERRQYGTISTNFRSNVYNFRICKTVPLNSFDSEEISIVSLIDLFQEKIMLLFNCILFERKCVILAHNIPASKVANYVLSSALMIPLLPEKRFLLRRFFPYVSFLEMEEVLPVSGFVIGTTNPIFLERSEWYDCLCNLNTGSISISCPEQMVEVITEDSNFIQNIIQLISQMRRNPRNSEHDIEIIIQSHFRQYALDIYRGAYMMDLKHIPTWEEFESGEWQKSKPRIMPELTKSLSFKLYLLMKTRSYRIWKKLKESKTSLLPIDIEYDLLLLRNSRYKEDELIILYVKWLKHIKSREEVIEFLNHFPESRGGLESIFIPLLHSNKLVQFVVVKFLQQLEKYNEGSYAISKCNFFLVLTYSICQKALLDYESFGKLQ